MPPSPEGSESSPLDMLPIPPPIPFPDLPEATGAAAASMGAGVKILIGDGVKTAAGEKVESPTRMTGVGATTTGGSAGAEVRGPDVGGGTGAVLGGGGTGAVVVGTGTGAVVVGTGADVVGAATTGTPDAHPQTSATSPGRNGH